MSLFYVTIKDTREIVLPTTKYYFSVGISWLNLMGTN
jgi:hypothetical protein